MCGKELDKSDYLTQQHLSSKWKSSWRNSLVNVTNHFISETIYSAEIIMQKAFVIGNVTQWYCLQNRRMDRVLEVHGSTNREVIPRQSG